METIAKQIKRVIAKAHLKFSVAIAALKNKRIKRKIIPTIPSPYFNGII